MFSTRASAAIIRRLGAAVALSFVLTACTGSESLESTVDDADVAEERVVDEADAETGGDDEIGTVEALGCDQATIAGDEGTLVAALAVEDGELAGRCFGEPDARLEAAWAELVEITPAAELADIDLLAGFEQPDSDTLAFASMLGSGNDEFVVAINLPLAEDDPEELRLTLAHEVAHVFGQTPDQLDVDVFEDECETFYNGNGCLLDDAYVTYWIEAFWSDEDLASLPDPTQADEEGGEDRCELNPTYLGSYAASHPEEDFAESFSAFVFRLEVAPSVQPKLDFFEQFPELVAFRDQVDAAGEPTPPNTFDGCG